jgi:hypothetical protein
VLRIIAIVIFGVSFALPAKGRIDQTRERFWPIAISGRIPPWPAGM